ncbi:MAG TPA: paraquat-inducible protein A [Acetobacteraceae bacterium]|nr:paraquat-inducible protein A [Acetobacteraceae bacterium]
MMPAASAAAPSLRECPGCGLFQILPAMRAGETARCGRCTTPLRRSRAHTFDRSLALTVAALVLLSVMATSTLMSVEEAGISRYVGLFGGPEELVERGMAALAVAVAFTVLIAPLLMLLGRLYVLLGLRLRTPPAHLRHVFRWAERLRPWAMLEVFLFGVFVAYVKLADLVTIRLGPGAYALMAITFVLIWAEDALDHGAVWNALQQARLPAQTRLLNQEVLLRGLAGCDVCGLVSALHRNGAHCPRCGAPLHPRKPASFARTWALVIAAAILYVPANAYPVLTVVQLGAGQPSTILGGVEELFAAQLYPLAALVFVASIAVPMLKLVGLAVLMISAQTGRAGWLRDRTRLYRFISVIGRWSMIDIFMESLLGALVKFGTIITIEPGFGAVAFCAVVVLTILASESFDPRLMWDAVEAVSAGAD